MSVRLCSLNELKSELRIPATETALDAILAAKIEAVGADCERFCHRTFTKAAYSNEVHPGDTDVVVLKHYPVNTAETFTVKDQSPLNFDQVVIFDTSDYWLDNQAGVVKLIGGLMFSSGPNAAQVSYNAGYAVLGTGDALKVDVPDDLSMSVRELAAARFKKQQGAIEADELAAEEKTARIRWAPYARIE